MPSSVQVLPVPSLCCTSRASVTVPARHRWKPGECRLCHRRSFAFCFPPQNARLQSSSWLGTRQSALTGTPNPFPSTSAGGVGRKKTLILFLRQNSLRTGAGTRSVCCDQRRRTQPSASPHLRPGSARWAVNHPNPQRRCPGPAYATSLRARIRFLHPPPPAPGRLLGALLPACPRPRPLGKRCTVTFVSTVVASSGNVISMMVPSLNTPFQSRW